MTNSGRVQFPKSLDININVLGNSILFNVVFNTVKVLCTLTKENLEYRSHSCFMFGTALGTLGNMARTKVLLDHWSTANFNRSPIEEPSMLKCFP